MRRLALLAVALLTAAQAVFAHEVRPAYLELRETAPAQYAVLWKVPAVGEDARLALYAELPAICTDVAPRRDVASAASFVERRTVNCAGGLNGGEIHIAGLSATITDVLVRIERLDGETQVTRLSPDAPSFVIAAAPGRMQIAVTYLKLGVEHILLGVDHLLFVFALLLLVEGTRRLAWTITAFTFAHSITLAGATLGLLNVPGPPVEACIALSIMFVAAEVVHGRRGRPGLTARWPWLVAFAFGLLHGFGFAGALREVGLPDQAIPVALLFFNVGVEAGQLLFIGAALITIGLLRRVGATLISDDRRSIAVAYAIGSVAAFWAIERLRSF